MCTYIRRVTRQGAAAAIQQHRLSRETLRQDAVCSGRHSTATLQEGRRGTSYLSYQLQGIALPRGDVYEQWRDPVVSLPR